MSYILVPGLDRRRCRQWSPVQFSRQGRPLALPSRADSLPDPAPSASAAAANEKTSPAADAADVGVLLNSADLSRLYTRRGAARRAQSATSPCQRSEHLPDACLPVKPETADCSNHIQPHDQSNQSSLIRYDVLF